MQLLRLALTGRWLGVVAMTTVFAVASVLLGQWQFDRRDYAREQIELLESNYDAPAVSISELIPSLDAEPRDVKWRSAKLTGRYLADDTRYVRNRIMQGTIGFEQLVPFQLESGDVFIVNRGWVPADAKYANPRVTPEPSDKSLTVYVRLYPDEAVVSGRGAPAGQIATINTDSFASPRSPSVYTGFYGQLVREEPEGSTGALGSRPLLDEGPHLSYALQWYVFALMAYFGYGWALLKEARGDAPINNDSKCRPRAPRIARDEDVEDAAVASAAR